MNVIQQSLQINSRSNIIWTALTEPAHTANWWGRGVVLEPRVGGEFLEPWTNNQFEKRTASGVVLSCKLNEKIEFTWHEDLWEKNQNTFVSIEIIAQGKNTSEVRLVHRGWEVFSETEKMTHLNSFALGWKSVLSGLKEYVENGSTL